VRRDEVWLFGASRVGDCPRLRFCQLGACRGHAGRKRCSSRSTAWNGLAESTSSLGRFAARCLPKAKSPPVQVLAGMRRMRGFVRNQRPWMLPSLQPHRILPLQAWRSGPHASAERRPRQIRHTLISHTQHHLLARFEDRYFCQSTGSEQCGTANQDHPQLFLLSYGAKTEVIET
jgi:hypothetical protein